MDSHGGHTRFIVGIVIMALMNVVLAGVVAFVLHRLVLLLYQHMFIHTLLLYISISYKTSSISKCWRFRNRQQRQENCELSHKLKVKEQSPSSESQKESEYEDMVQESNFNQREPVTTGEPCSVSKVILEMGNVSESLV